MCIKRVRLNFASQPNIQPTGQPELNRTIRCQVPILAFIFLWSRLHSHSSQVCIPLERFLTKQWGNRTIQGRWNWSSHHIPPNWLLLKETHRSYKFILKLFLKILFTCLLCAYVLETFLHHRKHSFETAFVIFDEYTELFCFRGD